MKKMKAIIVDDEKHVREGLLLLADWSRFGIDMIMEAVDGNEAIKLIKEHRPEIIFTDMSMPKRDGISLLKWIHSSDLSSKTIVVSGYDDFDYMRNAICYKSFDYILKPIDPDILNNTLEKAVNEWKLQSSPGGNQQEQIREMNVIQQIEQFLLENYSKEINLQEIADRFYLSREYISRRFKQEFQSTITDFITNARMNKAKELLHNPKLKIYEIAFQVGYQDEKYFSKVFKKVEGISPNEFRSVNVLKEE